MRLVKFSLLLGLVFGVGLVSADDPSLRDGRVNYWDAGAPVAVYCHFDGSNLSSIELLKINSSNQGELLLEISAADINAAGDQPAVNTLLAEAQGFKLYRLTNGEFEVMAPADKEGKVYAFTWERGSFAC